MARSTTANRSGRASCIIRHPAKLTLAAALCVLALPANGPWPQQDHLFTGVAAAGDRFGRSVAISGDTIVAGAPFHDTAAGSYAGSAYVFGPPYLKFFIGEPDLPLGGGR